MDKNLLVIGGKYWLPHGKEDVVIRSFSKNRHIVEVIGISSAKGYIITPESLCLIKTVDSAPESLCLIKTVDSAPEYSAIPPTKAQLYPLASATHYSEFEAFRFDGAHGKDNKLVKVCIKEAKVTYRDETGQCWIEQFGNSALALHKYRGIAMQMG